MKKHRQKFGQAKDDVILENINPPQDGNPKNSRGKRKGATFKSRPKSVLV